MNAEIFRHNLREMLRTKGLKQREFAEKAGLSYPWVRKVCSQGLTRVEDRNREQLGKICEILGVSPIEQMWNRNLLDQRDEASMYAAKVEKILRASCTSSDFIRYESVGGVSVMELADQIDKVHEAYESDRSSLEDRQSRRLTAQQSSGGRRTSHASEYTEKLRSLLRDDRPELRQQVSAILQLIDGAYHIDEGKRLEQRLKNERPDAHKRWLSSFGGNVGEVISELASTVPGKDEDELLDQLAEQVRHCFCSTHSSSGKLN